MLQSHAEQTVQQLLKPLYAFAKSRTATIQDAEDLAQEIALKLYRALTIRQDITEPEKFAWTIAHNTLANYYRSRSGLGSSVPIHGYAEVLPDKQDIAAQYEAQEAAKRLHNQIAYLSKTRRQIVIMHYFQGKRQHEIATALQIPLGTVKWHLSNAKTDLKKGLENMRQNTELKFNPIKFAGIGTNGSAGSVGGNAEYLRSALAQNILYLTRCEAMPVNEIADTLGVSPVYVESEVEFLEENGFMLKQGRGYIANVLIHTTTTEYNRQISEIYEKAAELFAPALYDALAEYVDPNNDGENYPHNDINFALWALIPYATAQSGTPDNNISFEEAATIRPDGGVNICNCLVHNPDAEPMKYSDTLSKIGGPSWNGDEDHYLLWLIDTVWGGDRVGNYHPDISNRDLSAIKTMFEGALSDDEAARMIERGFISRNQNPNGPGTIDALEIVWLKSEASKRMINLANTIREKYQKELAALKAEGMKVAQSKTPEHMKKAAAYGLQHIFLSDGRFIIYMLNKLVECGKLQLPTEQQRKSLCAVLVTK